MSLSSSALIRTVDYGSIRLVPESTYSGLAILCGFFFRTGTRQDSEVSVLAPAAASFCFGVTSGVPTSKRSQPFLLSCWFFDLFYLCSPWKRSARSDAVYLYWLRVHYLTRLLKGLPPDSHYYHLGRARATSLHRRRQRTFDGLFYYKACATMQKGVGVVAFPAATKKRLRVELVSRINWKWSSLCSTSTRSTLRITV